MQDGPQGIRFADYVSYFTSSQVAAATWDRGLIHARGAAMAAEAKGKGADVLLGPAVGPLGRHAAGGRNWEGFSPDPYVQTLTPAQAEALRWNISDLTKIPNGRCRCRGSQGNPEPACHCQRQALHRQRAR